MAFKMNGMNFGTGTGSALKKTNDLAKAAASAAKNTKTNDLAKAGASAAKNTKKYKELREKREKTQATKDKRSEYTPQTQTRKDIKTDATPQSTMKKSVYKKNGNDDKKNETQEERDAKINQKLTDHSKKVKDATGMDFSDSYMGGEYNEDNEADRLHDVKVQDAYDSRPPNEKTGDKGGNYYHMVRDPKMLTSGNVSLENYKGPAVKGVTPDDYVQP